MNLRSRSRLQLALLWACSMLLFPLLLAQGMRVRRVAERLPVASPPDEGTFGDEPYYSILGIGDSVIAGVGTESLADSLVSAVARRWHEQSGRATRWCARGVNGECLAELLVRLEAGTLPRADLVLVSIGVNDVTRLTSLLKWQLQITHLVSTLRQQRYSHIVLLGIPPMEQFPALPQPLRMVLGIRAALLDLTLRQIASLVDRVTWVGVTHRFDESHLASDGYHPNAEACVEIAEEVVSVLQEAESTLS